MSGDKDGSLEARLRAAEVKKAGPAPAGSGTTGPMGIGARVGVELLSALVVGLAIGWALDWWLGTKPWLLALFVLLGGGAGVANVWRLMIPRKR